MKTYNNHPHWANTPLRLNKEQVTHPVSVIEYFFENYHLHDVREIIWKWMVMVVTHKQSGDPFERDSDIYFYENIELLVEAAWMIMKRSQKHTCRKNRKRRWRSKL